MNPSIATWAPSGYYQGITQQTRGPHAHSFPKVTLPCAIFAHLVGHSRSIFLLLLIVLLLLLLLLILILILILLPQGPGE